jgi:hypothetical protein
LNYFDFELCFQFIVSCHAFLKKQEAINDKNFGKCQTGLLSYFRIVRTIVFGIKSLAINVKTKSENFFETKE